MGYIFDALNRTPDPDDPKNQPSGNRPEAPDQPLGPPPAVGAAPATGAGNTPATPAPEGQAPGHTETVTAQTGPYKIEPAPRANCIEGLRADDRLLAYTEPGSTMAEEYRSIRTSMLARWEQKRHLVHTITSATPQEGKTITTLNLGFSFAELRNRRIVVVEADLRLPLFEKMMTLPPTAGLVGLLEGQAPLSRVVHSVAEGRLDIITAGRRVDNVRAVQLLSSNAMTTLVHQLRNSYDHVIIDTPPVVELADAGILGSISDEVLLIARMNRTPRHLVEQALRTLTNYNASVGGLIATDQQRLRNRSYYYKYGYKYGYGYGSDDAGNTNPTKKAA
jgi:capsular exopolysaccharide synthesis family protein